MTSEQPEYPRGHAPGPQRLLRVLLVEPRQGDALLVSLMLEDMFDVHCVTDLDTALAATAALDPPDVALLDLGAVDADGGLALPQVRHAVPWLPLVGFAVDPRSDVALDAIDAGASDVVAVPGASPQVLVDAVYAAARHAGVERDLRQRGRWDRVTGLANAAELHQCLGHALERAARRGSTVNLVRIALAASIDSQRSLDAIAADHLRRVVAARINHLAAPGDTVARVGDDEFAVISEAIDDRRALVALAERVWVAVRRETHVEGAALRPRASIGIATGDRFASPDALFADAGAAVEVARAAGGDGWREQVAGEPAAGGFTDTPASGPRLLDAIAGGEFSLFYQPMVDFDSGRARSLEALLRWAPAGHFGAPIRAGDFVPSAEHSGAIGPLGDWALEESCRQGSAWQARGLPFARISVNVSPRQLEEPGFPDRVLAAVSATGLDPTMLELEVSDVGRVTASELASANARRLRDRGVRLAVDDFGSGRCSFQDLRHFGFDTLKLGRAMVDELDRGTGGGVMPSLVALARARGAEVVAAGVERAGQFEALRELAPDRVQGFYFAHPMPAGEIEFRYAA